MKNSSFIILRGGSDQRPRRNRVPRNQRERLTRERTLNALSFMRREKLSLTDAAQLASTTPESVLKYVGSAITHFGPKSRHKARLRDKIARNLSFPTPSGEIPITVRSSKTASQIAEYINAIRYRHRDPARLERFRGKSFRADEGVFHFTTDLSLLRQLDSAGLIGGEGFYRIPR